jgi:hypothetical protein
MERRIFFLCLLSFLMFAEGVSWFTAGGLGPCLIEPEHSQQAADNNEHEDCPTFFAGTLLGFQRGFDWIKRDDNDKGVVAGFTVVLAISTIGLWLATNRLWDAGERQLGHLSDTAERQLRAYIMAIRGRVKTFEIGKPVKVQATFKNTGQTPAYEVEAILGIIADDVPTEQSFEINWSDHSPHKGVTGSGETFSSFVGLTDPLTQDQHDAIIAGEAAVWAFGRARYRDAFGATRHTKFRFIFTGSAVTALPGAMSFTAEGNEAD